MSIRYNLGADVEVNKRQILHYVGLKLCNITSKVITIDVCKVTDTKRQVFCFSYSFQNHIGEFIVFSDLALVNPFHSPHPRGLGCCLFYGGGSVEEDCWLS